MFNLGALLCVVIARIHVVCHRAHLQYSDLLGFSHAYQMFGDLFLPNRFPPVSTRQWSLQITANSLYEANGRIISGLIALYGLPSTSAIQEDTITCCVRLNLLLMLRTF